jgi:4-hydroxy-tetrahydrodipicolinate synthase
VSAFAYRGVVPIVPTPFADDEALDLESLHRLLDFLADVGVAGATVLGVLGEAAALSDAEAMTVVRAAAEHRERLPIVVGAGRYSVRATRDFVAAVADAGADAVMIAPPSVDGMAEAALRRWFDGVIAESALPVVVQDHPASTRVHMSAALLIGLIDDHAEVVGLKCESVPTATKLRAVRQGTDRVPILTGLGALYGEIDLAAGSDGFNTGFAFPEVLVALVERARAGAWDQVRALHQRFLPLIVVEQQPGPALRKEIWRRRGVLASARVRAPGGPVDAWAAEHLSAVLADAFGDTDLTRPVGIATTGDDRSALR